MFAATRTPLVAKNFFAIRAFERQGRAWTLDVALGDPRDQLLVLAVQLGSNLRVLKGGR